MKDSCSKQLIMSSRASWIILCIALMEELSWQQKVRPPWSLPKDVDFYLSVVTFHGILVVVVIFRYWTIVDVVAQRPEYLNFLANAKNKRVTSILSLLSPKTSCNVCRHIVKETFEHIIQSMDSPKCSFGYIYEVQQLEHLPQRYKSNSHQIMKL